MLSKPGFLEAQYLGRESDFKSSSNEKSGKVVSCACG